MTSLNLVLLPLLSSSILFYLYNFFTSCHQYSFPYLVYIHREHCSKLDDLFQYALQPDIFDPLTDYNLPQSLLRGLCVTTSRKQFNSTAQLIDHLYSHYVFHPRFWSSPLVMDQCRFCLQSHWINASSPLNLLTDSSFDFGAFSSKMDKLSRYILQNCRFHSDLNSQSQSSDGTTFHSEILKSKVSFTPKSSPKSAGKIKNKNPIIPMQPISITNPDGHSNRVLIVGASSGGLVTALSMFKSSLFGPASSFNSHPLTIIDKRDTYSRTQWFDLIGTPFYHTLDVLFDEMAFDTQSTHFVNETNDNLTTILLPSSVLERFLAKTVTMIGVDIEYNHQYLGYCNHFENVAVILNNKKLRNTKYSKLNIKPRAWKCGSKIDELVLAEDEISKLNRLYMDSDSDSVNDEDSNSLQMIFDRDMFRLEQFSVIIGSDGIHSGVRSMYSMGWYQQNTIDIARFVEDLDRRSTVSSKSSNDGMQIPSVPVTVDNLHQISLLANFKVIGYSDSLSFNENDPYSSHNCPSLVIGNDDRILDPWSASFHVDGVHTVFKRFYHNDCQMQILLNREMGERVLEEEGLNEESLVMSIVWKTAKHYLKNPPRNEEELRDRYLVSAVDGVEGHFADKRRQIMILNHSCLLPRELIKVIGNGRHDDRDDDRDGRNDEAIVLLVGDASMKSHYRLGVGINRILDSYHESIRFYYNVKRTMLGDAKFEDFVPEFKEYIEGKLRYFVEFQASTMFMEAFCDFIVFFNPNDDLTLAQTLVWRDSATHDYMQLSSVNDRNSLIRKCVTHHQ